MLREFWLVLSGHYVREAERRVGRGFADMIAKGYPVGIVDRRFVVRFRYIPDYVSPRYSASARHRIAMAAMEAFR